MLFIDNKYTKLYYSIINRAKTRCLEGYKEKHHIIPKSLGGSNDKDNLVNLTAREHFLCHYLLTKMTTGQHKSKMVHAANMMLQISNDYQSRYTQVNSKIFEQIKKEYSVIRRGVPASVESRRKNSESHKGRPATKGMTGKTHKKESKQKIAAANTGKTHSEDTKNLLRQRTLDQISAADYINPMTVDSVVEHHKQQCILRSSKKYQCVHCLLYFSKNTLARWHGDNCKLQFG